MARFYRTSAPQAVDYVYNQPTEFMYQVMQQADQKINQLQDQQYLFETTAGNVPLQVLSEYRNTAQEAVSPYIERIDEYANILSQGDAKEYLRQQGNLRRIGQDLNKELTLGNTGRLIQNTQSFNEYAKRLTSDNDIDPALREAWLNSRYDKSNPNGLYYSIRNSLEGGGLDLREVPVSFDIQKELTEAAKNFGLDEYEMSELVRGGANNVRGFITQLTKSGKTIDADKAAAVFEGIFNDPRNLAIENFRDYALNQRYVQTGTNPDGTPIYASNQNYINSKIQEQAEIYGYENMTAHLQALSEPFEKRKQVLDAQLQNGSIKPEDYRNELDAIRKELGEVVSPIRTQYEAINNIARTTTDVNNALTGREVRHNQLYQSFLGRLPGEVKKENFKLIENAPYMENLRQANKMALQRDNNRFQTERDAAKFKFDIELEELKQKGELDKLKLKNYYEGLGSTGSGKLGMPTNLSPITPGTGAMVESPLYNPTTMNFDDISGQIDSLFPEVQSLSQRLESLPPDSYLRPIIQKEIDDKAELLMINQNHIKEAISRNPQKLAEEISNVRKKLNASIYASTSGRSSTSGAIVGGNNSSQVYERMNAIFTDETFDKLVDSPTVIHNKRQASELLGIPESMLTDDDVKVMETFQTEGLKKVTESYFETAKNATHNVPAIVLDLNDPQLNSALSIPLATKNYTITDANGRAVQFKSKNSRIGIDFLSSDDNLELRDILGSNGYSLKDLVGSHPTITTGSSPENVRLVVNMKDLGDKLYGRVADGEKLTSGQIFIEIPKSDIPNQDIIFNGKAIDNISKQAWMNIMDSELYDISKKLDGMDALNGGTMPASFTVNTNINGEPIAKPTRIKVNITRNSVPLTSRVSQPMYNVEYFDVDGKPLIIPGTDTNTMIATKKDFDRLPVIIKDTGSLINDVYSKQK